MENGIEKLIGDFPGMSFAPRFSPDGKSVLMSIANDGMSHIYQLNLVTGAKKRLTKGRSINTSPCYTPEQKQIIFNSDRSGRPHLYIMDSDGSNVKRISSNIGRYATPVVSPRGDLIAYTKWADGSGLFSIGVMNLDGSGERIVARGYLVEGPTWSPNGRVIMYSKQLKGFKNNPGKVNLYSVDITGYNEKIIKTKNQASDPSWSSILD
jgi:TolB protein